MGGRARVQLAGWTMLHESCTEPLAVTLRHGHVSFCSVDDITDTVGIVFCWAVSAVVSEGSMWVWVSGGSLGVSVWIVLSAAPFIVSILRSEPKPLGCSIELVVIASAFVVRCLVEGVLQ